MAHSAPITESIDTADILSRTDHIVLNAVGSGERLNRESLMAKTGLGHLVVTLALYRLAGLGLLNYHETKRGPRKAVTTSRMKRTRHVHAGR